jgi:serine/threonine protein kinase
MIGKLLDQRYLVVELLGKGGFGHTYIAQDTRRPGNPACVVKHLQPATNDPNFLGTARRLFSREAEALEKLGNHDQIPRLLAYFEEKEEFFLVQEFIDGHPLSMELAPGNRWSEALVLQLLQEILPILEFIHDNEVIHRDLKPQNIIRRVADNKLVLVDFGAVKQVKMYSLMNPEQMKNETIPIGTPGYMPSEQAQGHPRPNSDIYALGIIAIQALTGLSPKQIIEDPITGEMIWQKYAQVSDQLAAILTKMVRQYYKIRYQSADEVLQAIASLANPNTPTAVAAVVNHMLRQYLREGYVSATKIVRSLAALAKPYHTPPDDPNTLGPTLPLEPPTQKAVLQQQTTVTVSQGNSPALPFRSKQNSTAKSRRKLQLSIGAGGAMILVMFSVISARPPQQQPSEQVSDLTTQNSKIQQNQESTHNKTTTTKENKQQNHCIVVTRSSNLRSVSGRRRTGKVIKAGTRVTVTGKQEGGWLEISAPESGWIWKSRTKNTCPS